MATKAIWTRFCGRETWCGCAFLGCLAGGGRSRDSFPFSTTKQVRSMTAGGKGGGKQYISTHPCCLHQKPAPKKNWLTTPDGIDLHIYGGIGLMWETDEALQELRQALHPHRGSWAGATAKTAEPRKKARSPLQHEAAARIRKLRECNDRKCMERKQTARTSEVPE